MAAKKTARKQSTKNTAITSLVPMGTAHTVSVMDTDQSFALVPSGYARVIVESVHGGVIVDSTLTDLTLSDAAVAQTQTGPVIVDMERAMDEIAQSAVGYVRNATRAIYARYIVQCSLALLASVNAGQKTNDDGSTVLYRVADVARVVINEYRKRLKLGNKNPLPKPIDVPRMRAILGDVRDPAHHAKCLIAGGLFNSHDLPSAILWDAARTTPFYALPNSPDMPFLTLIYGDEMGHGAGFNHQLASDFLARLHPSYVTPTLYKYVSALNGINYTALHKFLRVYLDQSRLNQSLDRCLDLAYDAASLHLTERAGNKSLGYLERMH